MARMHSRKRGKAASSKPIGRPAPKGLKLTAKQIEELVLKLGKEGMPASRIGLALRDEHGVPDVKAVTGKRIARILADNKAQPELPEDLVALIRKAVLLRKHLESNAHDEPAKRGLTLTESKVLRLTRHYKKTGRVKASWNYNPKEASYLAE